MGKTKKKLTKEEKLAKDRLRKKQEYIKIKNDPELYELQKEKERKRYLMRKEKNKIVKIQDMSTRAQREQRRRWRENSRNYSKKKKEQQKLQRILLEDSPPASDIDDSTVVLPEPLQDQDPLAQNHSEEENVHKTQKKSSLVRRVRYKAMKVIKKLKEEIVTLKKEKDLLRKRTKKLELQQKSNKKSPGDSLKKKVDLIVEDIPEDKVQGVKRKLIFDESLSRGLKKKYNTMTKKEKRSFVEEVILSNDSQLKQYKVKSRVPFTIRKQLSESRKNKTKEVKQKIQEFFEDDAVSSVAPGKKAFIKRRGVKKHKRTLSDNLKNLHNKYVKQQGNVSYATFCKYRPFWVVFPDDKRDTCLCKLHCNTNLLLEALKTAKITAQGTVTEMLDYLFCNSSNEACLKRMCNICKNKGLNYKEFDNSINIKYKVWTAEKKNYLSKNGKQQVAMITTKKTLEEKPRNVILKLEDSMDVFFKHTHNLVVQIAAMKELKKNLGETEVIIHVDFSENYSLKFHEEVQSFHFGGSRGQISLHTVVLYYLDHKTGLVTPKSICTISQCLNHDASAIWAHINPVLTMAKELVPSLTKVHFLSDSPSSQYRNRYIFYMISRLQREIQSLNLVTWNYQEAGHGKGAPDGIGAVVKTAADRHVKFGGDVGSFQDFENVLRQKITHISVIVVSEDEVSRKKFPETVPGFKGTTSVHQAIWSLSLPCSIAFRSLSCFSCLNISTPCIHGKHLGMLKVSKEETPKSPDIACGEMNFEHQVDNSLQIDTPTVLNNIDENMILDEIDDTLFLDEAPSQLAAVDKKKTGIQILSNVPFDYARYKARQTVVQPFDLQQREFERFLSARTDCNNAGQELCDQNITKHDVKNSDEKKRVTPTLMDIEGDKENVVLKYKLDDWVIVKYTVKEKAHFFIGKITAKDEGSHEYTIAFLKKLQGQVLKFNWPTIPDDDMVTNSQIIQCLSEPEQNRRGQFVFKNLPKLNFK